MKNFQGTDMNHRTLIKLLQEIPKNSVVLVRALVKTYYLSSMHSAANFSTVEIDLRKKKNRKQNITKLIFPKLTDNIVEHEQSIASFHITPSAVSWAKMSSVSKDLIEWDIVNLTEEIHKIHITTIYEKVLEITNLLPKADLYVMEEMSKPKPSSTGTVFANIYLLQFRAIMLAYLNEFKVLNEESDIFCNNKVYFLRSLVAARLSSTLVGSEKVSSEQTVKHIFNLSCPQYSHVIVDENLKQKYMLKESVDKENMGRALLLIMAFRDLVILKSPQSLEHIARGH